MRRNFNWEELSNISMTVALFYLIYSAYFIVQDFSSLKFSISMVLAFMHAWIVFQSSKSIYKNLWILNENIWIAGNDITLEALRLKRVIMIQIWISIVLYYSNEVIYTFVYGFTSGNEASSWIYMAKYFLTIMIVFIFFIFLRARKWPDYFSVDLQLQQELINNQGEVVHRPPIMNNILRKGWIGT